MKFSKVIDLEDFSSQELSPYLRELAEKDMAYFGIDNPIIIPDSKNWETAMALYSFEKNHLLKEGKLFAGIGAGTEVLTELLANKGAIVFPVDRYLEQTAWSDVVPPGYMISVSEYIRTSTNTQNIIPVHSDARALDLPSNFFDGVYSSGTIEHLGGLDAIEASAAEIGRILKPGGIASISTEFWLNGPEHIPWFDENYVLFTPDLIERHIILPSGLEPIGIPDIKPSAKTYETRKMLVNFLSSANNIQDFEDKSDTYPNLILFHDGFIFCSVHILLKKPMNWKPKPNATLNVDNFRKKVQSNNSDLIDKLKHFFSQQTSIKTISDQYPIAIPNGCKLSKTSLTTKILKIAYSSVKNRPWLKRFLLRILIRFPKFISLLKGKLNTN